MMIKNLNFDTYDTIAIVFLCIGVVVEVTALFIWDYNYILNTIGLIFLGISFGYLITQI